MADTLERDLNRFLAGVERKALAFAELSVRDRDDAMDIVQDAMIRLVRKYAHKPPEEWTPLFFRILTNRIRDMQRRRKVRDRVFSWIGGNDPERPDPVADAPDPATSTPDDELEAAETHRALETAVAGLPERQREAFYLRSIEGLDVAATAKVMGCSAGSVKTHYFRALAVLRESLQEQWR